MEINIIKCHGSENDFILIDEIDSRLDWTPETRSKFAITLCDRTNGIGADGILFLQDGTKVVIINSDGSEAKMCGNGLRCTARYYCEKYNVEKVAFETKGGLVNTCKAKDIYEGIATYCVEIGPIDFKTNHLPMNWPEETLINRSINYFDDTLKFTAASIPNPHLISIVDYIDSFKKLEGIAKIANANNPYFPDGVNVTFVNIIKNGTIYVRTYERGVGFTNACGTAMSASSYISRLLDYVSGDTLEVHNDGGLVHCKIADTSVNLIGNATYEYTAKINYDNTTNKFEIFDKTYNLIDIKKYEVFKRKSIQFLKEKLERI